MRTLAFLCLLGVAAGCNWMGLSGVPKDEPVEAIPGEPFWLGVGQTAHAPGDRTVTFLDVLGDSRCPEGAVCVWEGEARILAGWSAPDVRTRPDTLALRGGTPVRPPVLGPFTLLALAPYPHAERPLPAREAYRAQFVFE